MLILSNTFKDDVLMELNFPKHHLRQIKLQQISKLTFS